MLARVGTCTCLHVLARAREILVEYSDVLRILGSRSFEIALNTCGILSNSTMLHRLLYHSRKFEEFILSKTLLGILIFGSLLYYMCVTSNGNI